jgi:indolepyruvate ferredoxin oxidoreductase beta subunit
MDDKSTNIIFAGVGGQGNVLVSHLLADAALESGFPVRLTETYGAATRGGSVFSCVRIGNTWAPLPKEDGCKVIVGLEPLEAIRAAVNFLSSDGLSLVNVRPWIPIDVSSGRVQYPDIEQILGDLKCLGSRVISLDATQVAQDLGNSRMMNVVLLGGLMALEILDLKVDAILYQIEKRWVKASAYSNRIAFQTGYDTIKEMMK